MQKYFGVVKALIENRFNIFLICSIRYRINSNNHSTFIENKRPDVIQHQAFKKLHYIQFIRNKPGLLKSSAVLPPAAIRKYYAPHQWCKKPYKKTGNPEIACLSLRACLNFVVEISYAIIFERNKADFAAIAGNYGEKSNAVAASK